MFNLLRRSKNRKSLRQNNEDLSNHPVANDNAVEGLNRNEIKTQPKLYGRLNKALDALEDFNNLEEIKTGKGQEMIADERKQKLADIYFESSKGKNANVANSSAAEIKTVGKSGAYFSSSSGSGSGRSSTAKDNDSALPLEESYSLLESKTPSRRSLAFRRIDLDGVNSLIEAVVPEGDSDDLDDDVCEESKSIATVISNDHDNRDQPDSERSSIDRRFLSPNERAEWSGRKSPSIHSDASKSDKSQLNVRNKTSIAFNNNELNATNSIGACNVRSTDYQNEETTTETHNAINEGEKVVNSEVISESSAPFKLIRRRSFFQRKKPKLVTDESVQKLGKLERGEAQKSQGALQKGKKFLSSIFMARGRQHHQQQNQRNRNQVLQHSSSNQQLQQEPCSSNTNDQHAAVGTDHNNRENATTNKDTSTISDTRNTQNFIANDQKNSTTMLRQHLETSNSPIRQRDPAASVQMTLSNNSLKNASRRDSSGTGGKPQYRSNSVELPRECRENERYNLDVRKSERAYSEEPQVNQQQRWSGANTSNARAPLIKEHVSRTTPSGSLHDHITCAKSIEQNGVNAENLGTDSFADNYTDVESSEKLRSVNDDGELTACARRDRSETSQYQKQDLKDSEICVDAISMGQTYGRSEAGAEYTRATSPLEHRQTYETRDTQRPAVPKITVQDFSFEKNRLPSEDSPTENDVFYDFENIHMSNGNKKDNENEDEDFDDTDDDEEFHEQVATSQPASFSIYHQHSPMRYSPVKLEDVQEEDEGLEEPSLDNRSQRPSPFSASPDRFPLKSSDSNLSNSYPDSGISGCSESQVQSTTENDATKSTMRSSLPAQSQRRPRSPFARDSASTDCDDTVLQCDEFDCFVSTPVSTSETTVGSTGDRLVCIESISLPDVVESTTSSPGSGNSQNCTSANSSSSGTGGEQIININGATGNNIGNVHFIPIHVEGDRDRDRDRDRCRGGGLRPNSPNQQKPRSFDDNFLGNGMNSTRFSHHNGGFDLSDKPTIEIIEDEENSFFANNSDKIRIELDEQKSRFSAQLDDAQKNVQNLQTKINEMQTKIANLEQELSSKTWNVERLQSELNAAQREDEFVRKKLRLLQEEKTELRHKFNESEDEYRRKYLELETEYIELQEKYKSTQQLASNLHTQLAAAQTEVEDWRNEIEKIRTDLEDQIRILKNALENSEAERKICEDKWQKEYELLRTQHMDREETLMTDCEWQLRQMQRQWKDKLDKSEEARRDAIDSAEIFGIELEARKHEVDDLRHYEAEVKSLRGVVNEQHNSITILMNQIEDLKADLQIANSKLEDQIEAVAKIKFQCDNALCDKERQMVYRIDEVRNEAACFWESKLYTEMTRLKHELESVYVDERREALDKLQAEHIEELRALTTRYTANEEDLRQELAELQERFENKSQEFLDLRQKSDNAILQTRMHLDRADREYQNAMCREEDRREALEETLRQEFETEKVEMETKFQERLNHVKEEFSNELLNAKQETLKKHQKELEQIKVKLRAERDEAMQDLVDRHRQKMAAAEEQMKAMDQRHQDDLNELKSSYDEDKVTLDKRDMSNANEIEQLHRRCRCLTNLFEEMRMRYERRDPRAEDLREIDELRARCDSQERDLFTLTATLREMQLQNHQNDKTANQTKKGGKSILKPPPKTIPTSCDVIYEDENEERESPPPPPLKVQNDEDVEYEDEDENKNRPGPSNHVQQKKRKLVNGISSNK